MMKRFQGLVIGVFLAFGWSLSAIAADQWWDAGTAAGLQSGVANWSTSDNAWSPVAGGTTTPGPWTNGNDAYFVVGAASTSIISGTVTANRFSATQSGGGITVITNGTLALGAGGLSMNSYVAFSFFSPVKLLTNQLWTMAGVNGQTVSFPGGITEDVDAPASLTLDVSPPANMTALFNGTSTFSGGLNLRRGNLTGYAQESGSPFGAAGNNLSLGTPVSSYAQLALQNATGDRTATVGDVTINDSRAYLGVISPAATTGTLAAANLVRNGRGCLNIVFADSTRERTAFTGGEAANTSGMAPAWVTQISSFTVNINAAPNFVSNSPNGFVIAPYNTNFDYARDDEIANLAVTAMADNNTAYAVRVTGASLNISNFTLTVGDGVRPAGLMLTPSATCSITGDVASAIDFRGSEGVISAHPTLSPTIYTTIRGTNGFTKGNRSNLTIVSPQSDLWSGPTVIHDGTLTLNLSGSPTYSDDVRGYGSLIKAGTGLLTLNGSNTLGGTVTVTGGGGLSVRNQVQGGYLIAGILGGDNGNSLYVTNNAQLSTVAGKIGYQCNSNTAVISGNSIWNLGGGALYVGQGNNAAPAGNAIGNVMIVDNSVVTNAMKPTWEQGGLAVGYGGNTMWAIGNSVILTNGARLYTAYLAGQPQNCSGSIGNGLSLSNSMTVAGSYWNLGGGDLFVGSANQATGNVLRLDGLGIAGGTVVTNIRQSAFNHATTASSNQVLILNGARLYQDSRMDYNGNFGLVLLSSNALWRTGAGGYFYMGGANNTLCIESGSQLVINNGLYLFTGGAGMTNNLILVTGSNSIFRNDSGVINIGGNNGSGTGATGNWMRVESGGVFTNGLGGIYMAHGLSSRGNTLSVNSGGQMFTAGASRLGSGAYCSDNVIQVRDANSLWDMGNAALTVGGGGTSSFNRVWIDNGMATRAGFTVGGGVGAYSNAVVITNNALVSSGAGSNIGNAVRANDNTIQVTGSGTRWDLRGTTLAIGIVGSLNNALIIDQGGTVDNIGTLTLSGTNQINLLGGTLGVTNVTLVSVPGPAITVGDGAQPATLKAMGGKLAFTNGLTIATQATLTGTGTIQGDTTVYGTLSPGSGIGVITNLGACTLTSGALSKFDLAAYTAPRTGWDLLVATNTLTLAGDLKVYLNGAFVPAANNSFLIMTNTVNLVDAGGWNNTRAPVYKSDTGRLAGSLRVVVGAQNVILTDYSTNPPGSVILLY